VHAALTGLAVGPVLTAIGSRPMTALPYGFRPDYVPIVTVVPLKDYCYMIVGVVEGIREGGIGRELRPAVYLLHEQESCLSLSVG
jgi:hypothetical protein